MLTVVVPTIPGRESLLSRCLFWLTPQPVDILVVEGTGKLGDKLNAAWRVVETPYVAACDDDDYVTADYGQVIERLGMVDYCGFKFLELTDNGFHNICSALGDYEHWGIRSRPPSVKCPLLTAIARDIPFGNAYKADRAWGVRVRDRINDWAFIDRPLYVHDWHGEQSTFYAGKHRDVGFWPFDESRIHRMTVDSDT